MSAKPQAKASAKAVRKLPATKPSKASAASGPTHLNLYAYQVGFGDCFLLQFVYGPGEADKRHVLIDFGTTGAPDNDSAALMMRVAKDIEEKCKGSQLHAVVATHRHADHISGFATKAGGKGSGDIIKALKPKVVLQPWTEDLKLETDATGPRAKRHAAGSVRSVSALNAMNSMASQVAKLASDRPKSLPLGLAERIEFLGRDNTRNLSAVENLAYMGKAGNAVYAHFGVKDPLKKVLPGVTTHVLGPPTVEQFPAIQKQRSTDDDEFWHFHARGAATANAIADNDEGPFDDAYVFAKKGKLPRETRWVANRISGARGNQLLGIVTMLDKAMNNTSLILLMEVGGKRLLFPGDAQWENWSYALGQPKIAAMLADVDLYKVGHHGSLNATPKSLWKTFSKRGTATKKNRMTSVLSTLSEKHGSLEKRTEVPRKTLVEQLKSDTHLHSTQDLANTELFKMVRLDFS